PRRLGERDERRRGALRRTAEAAMTLFLDRDQIVKLLTIDDCIGAVERVFRDGGEAASLGLGHFHVKAAIAGNRFAVKCNGNFPENPERYGLPTIQGLIILADA